MADWYISTTGQTQGPYNQQQLKELVLAGTLGPQHHVWREGMPQWLAAGSVNELAGLFAALPVATALPVAAAGSAPVLAYATPGGAIQPDFVPQLLDDPGPFLRLGKRVKTPKSLWYGLALASPWAIYLLKRTQQLNAYYGAGFGLAGVLVTAAAASEPDDYRTCTVADLPPAVRQQLDPKNKNADRDVIVIPKTSVNQIKFSFWSHLIRIDVGAERLGAWPRMFGGRAKAKKFLLANGWPVNTPVVATTGPMHGQSLGRAFADRPQAMAAWKRALLIIGAILLFLLIVFGQLLFGHH